MGLKELGATVQEFRWINHLGTRRDDYAIATLPTISKAAVLNKLYRSSIQGCTKTPVN